MGESVYKQMYLTLNSAALNAHAKILESLAIIQSAQLECEELYMQKGEPEDNNSDE